jgi:hypothetical protein
MEDTVLTLLVHKPTFLILEEKYNENISQSFTLTFISCVSRQQAKKV